MSTIIKAQHLHKHYGATRAMDDLSFTIEKGAIVGLLGPNGAGKTTTLNALLGLTDFDGELEVLGMDPRHGRQHIMERVCFIADVGILPRWLKVSEALEFVAAIHPRFNRSKAEHLLSTTKISLKDKVKALSKGMVTQLHLALILAIDVELLVLDEPTLGLDILFQKAFFDRLLNDYYDNNTSIIISTHQVDEVAPLLTHLMLINNGKLVVDSPMETLTDTFCEVLVSPEHYTQAQALQPLYTRELLGRKGMLFENRDLSTLQQLGEIQIPRISDLFAAKLHSA